MLRTLANFIRGSTRCMFPIATMVVWLALLLVPQGTDVLRAELERLQVDGSWNDLIFLWISSATLALSIWYSMRWLLSAQMSALPMSGSPDSAARVWLPRLSAAFAPALIAVVVSVPATFPTLGSQNRFIVVAAFAGLSGMLLLFFWRRATWAPMAGQVGRTPTGRPGTLGLNEPLPASTLRILGWGLMLTALLAAIFLLFALSAPRIVGAAAVAGLALASINLFGSFVLTYLPMRSGLPPLAPWLIIYAVAIGGFNDNHGARTATFSAPPVAKRLTPEQSFAQWSKDLPDGDFYIVAAEGGGLRAAYWTAEVLERLEHELPGFSDRVFALSGVSGGSVGVGMWVAAMRARHCDRATDGATPAPSGPPATRILSVDYLSPSIAGLFYDDLTQRFIPFPFSALDRSRGLEEGWERAAYRIPGRPLERTIDAFYQGCDHLPELLLNSTVAETGQRAVLSRLDTQLFIDTREVTDTTITAQSLAGLIHQSARFPLISPAGSVRALPDESAGWLARLGRKVWPDTRMRLVDGGYFDNSGIQTALELASQIQPALASRPKLTPVLIVITNDAGTQHLCGPPTDEFLCPYPTDRVAQDKVPVWRWLHESTPIFRALYNVRDSHIRILAEGAVRAFHQQVVIVQPPPLQKNEVGAPLGWALSSLARDQLHADVGPALAFQLPAWQRRDHP